MSSTGSGTWLLLSSVVAWNITCSLYMGPSHNKRGKPNPLPTRHSAARGGGGGGVGCASVDDFQSESVSTSPETLCSSIPFHKVLAPMAPPLRLAYSRPPLLPIFSDPTTTSLRSRWMTALAPLAHLPTVYLFGKEGRVMGQRILLSFSTRYTFHSMPH